MAQRGTSPSTDQLRALVRSGPRTPGRSEAFIELVAREPQGLNRTLRSLALDPETDQEMRVKAVTALGRKSAPSSRDALRAALKVDDETVRFRAIERLGKIGAPEDLTLLENLQSNDRTTERALHTARYFLSYRHRLAAHHLDVSERQISAGGTGAAPIRTGRPTKAMTNRMALVAPAVAGIKLSPLPSVRIECRGQELALVMNQVLVDDGLATLAERQGLPAVLVVYNNEVGTYEAFYYLMTDPRADGQFRILGVRSTGRVGLQGTGTVGDDTIGFEINATEEPLSHPLSVKGSYDPRSDRIRFDLALIDPKFSDTQQALRRQPQLVGPER